MAFNAIKTRLTDVLLPHVNIRLPIVSAPMAYVSGGLLAAAVSSAGGLGLIGAGYYPNGDGAVAEILKARGALPPTTNYLPIGIGFVSWWVDKHPALLTDVLTKSPAPLAAVWFAGGEYIKQVELVKKHWPETKIIIQISSPEEYPPAVQSKLIDIIAVQGLESGGHGSASSIPTLPLLTRIINLHHPTLPLLPAGGLTTGRELVSCLSLGAAGVVMGTRFLCSTEALATKEIKDAIVANSDSWNGTVRTAAFDKLRAIDWPQEYDGRVLKNKVTDALENGKTINELKESFEKGLKEKDTNYMVVWAGTGADKIESVEPAAKIVEEIGKDAIGAWKNLTQYFT